MDNNAQYNLSPQNIDEYLQVWEAFINSKPYTHEEELALDRCKKVLEPVIYDSWLNSKRNNVDPFTIKDKKLPYNKLKKLLEKNKLLIEIAKPYMYKLSDFLDKQNFSVIVSDNKGYTLAQAGGEGLKISQIISEDGVDIGVNRSEEYAGTNGIGLCIKLKRPVQILASEHYVQQQRHYAASAAPIKDVNGEMIGCFVVYGHTELAHPHTLGMAIAAADGIRKEMQLHHNYDKLASTHTHLTQALQYVNLGLIITDRHLKIIEHNKLAEKMLRTSGSYLAGNLIYDVLKEETSTIDWRNITQPIRNKPMELLLSSGKNHSIVVEIDTIKDAHGEFDGFIITIDEMKSIHSFISNMSGFMSKYSFDSIIGNSRELYACKRNGLTAAQSSSNLLILGESGTGKELFAHAVHSASNRADKPFVPINCASLPRQLIESELFGYEGGAFTGANKNGQPGKFELADGGTIFLDEIGDMPLEVQATLLRVLQTKEIVRIGGKTVRPVDVRIISATNKNLLNDVANKKFRADLYYRLNVLSLTIPPLRNRTSDMPLLVEYFISKYSDSLKKDVRSISQEAMNVLIHYQWPGNIRELENVIERAINVCSGTSIEITDIGAELFNRPENTVRGYYNDPPIPLQDVQQRESENRPAPNPSEVFIPATPESSDFSFPSFNRDEIKAIKNALHHTNGNVKKAAELLNVSRKTLYNKINRYDIDVSDYRL